VLDEPWGIRGGDTGNGNAEKEKFHKENWEVRLDGGYPPRMTKENESEIGPTGPKPRKYKDGGINVTRNA